ncbi:GM17312 [Drosophila sechellia]|uniref:GM17312 n=1 Tax=Drosophila sechellia TaxID=7238 RepID=B4I5P5_DROSE|nr:GM17312 [Drosophila sechellia]
MGQPVKSTRNIGSSEVRRQVGLREAKEVEKPERQSRTTGAQTQGRGRAFSDDDDDAGGGLPALASRSKEQELLRRPQATTPYQIPAPANPPLTQSTQ